MNIFLGFFFRCVEKKEASSKKKKKVGDMNGKINAANPPAIGTISSNLVEEMHNNPIQNPEEPAVPPPETPDVLTCIYYEKVGNEQKRREWSCPSTNGLCPAHVDKKKCKLNP